MSFLKFPALLACLLLPLTLPAAPLRVGGFVVAPIITGSGNSPLQGALREYMEQKVVGHAGVELVWTPPTSLPRAMENLRNGSLDILLLTSGSLAPYNGVAPFNWSYLQAHPHLAVLKNSPLRAVQSLQQLAGVEIGWVGGSAVMDELNGVPIQWQFLTVQDWQTLNLRKLQAGRIQAVFFENEYSPRYYAASEEIDIELVKLPLPARLFGMAYSLKANRAAIAQFDRVAAAAFVGEQFKAFLDQYLKR
ncbi:MAG: transporter substrate-binding domain-containing protein [Pseudomonadota bacterium]